MKKILKNILTIGAIATPTLSVVAATSCQSTNLEVLSTANTYIVGDASNADAHFTVSNAKIEEGQSVETTMDSQFFGISSTTVKNNSLTINFIRKTADTERRIEEKDLHFVCKKNDGSIVWQYTLNGYKIGYIPGASITENQKVSLSKYDDNGSYMDYDIELEKELSSDITLKAEIKNLQGAEVNVTNVAHEGKTLKVRVSIVGDISDESVGSFDMVISAVDEFERLVYSPSTLTGFKLTYCSGINAVPYECFNWTTNPSNGTPVLSSVNFDDARASNCNALRLPARYNDTYTYEIAADAFYKNGKTLIPSRIKQLILRDITAITIPEDAFQAAPFTIINLKEQTSEKSGTVADISFGDRAFAFANASGTGTGNIYFNNVLTETEQNLLLNKFWLAGLTSPNWYGFTRITTEQELQTAAKQDGKFYLGTDITLTNPVEFSATTALLDLCGHSITSNSIFKDEEGNVTGLICLSNGGNLEVFDSTDSDGTGKGTIKPFKPENDENGSYAFHCLKSGSHISTLTIYGGTYYGNESVIYNAGAKVYIKSIYDSAENESFAPRFHVLNEGDSTVIEQTKAIGKYMLRTDPEWLASLGTNKAFVISAGAYYWAWTGANANDDNRYNPNNSIGDKEGISYLADGFKVTGDATTKIYTVKKS